MTTEEQRAKQREYSRRYREANREKVRESNRIREKAARSTDPDRYAFHQFMYRQRHPERKAATRSAWIEQNPERHKENQRNAAWRKRSHKISGRRGSIAKTKDKAALGERILANARAVIPSNVGDALRAELASMMAQRVYEGRYPIRLRPWHAKEVMTDHFRMFTNFGPESLDAPCFEDGAITLLDTISEGLWQ